jgi:hypothetical protein
MANKSVRGWSLSIDNREWLEKEAVIQTAIQGRPVSASAILDEIVTNARQAQEAHHSNLNKLLAAIREEMTA